MNRCTYCGKEYPDDITVCSIDGQAVEGGALRSSAKPPPLPGSGWFDQQFSKTSRVVLILGGFCLAGPVLILGVLGLICCKDPKARENAKFAVVFTAAIIVVGTLVALDLKTLLRQLAR